MTPDVVVVGAGIVGAACAYHLTRAGARVTVLDSGPLAGGTSSAGDGNIRVSYRSAGAGLELAVWSRQLWTGISDEIGADRIEFTRKGSLVVARTPEAYEGLLAQLPRQRAAGVDVVEVPAGGLGDYEQQLATGLAGGAYHPRDARVDPVLATAHLLAASGAELRCGERVRAVDIGTTGRTTGVRLDGGVRLRAGAVVNATGLAAGELARTAGTRLPITARRGFVLVTEALRNAREALPIGRTVYEAGYLDAVTSAEEPAGGVVAPVVTGTRAGALLIGSSRDQGGADPAYPLPLLRRLAAAAVRLFPLLAGVRVVRSYRGFRPFVPDHLPIIGEDPHAPGLWHACGHEGSGVALAPATGALITALVTGASPAVDPDPYRPSRWV